MSKVKPFYKNNTRGSLKVVVLRHLYQKNMNHNGRFEQIFNFSQW